MDGYSCYVFRAIGNAGRAATGGVENLYVFTSEEKEESPKGPDVPMGPFTVRQTGS